MPDCDWRRIAPEVTASPIGLVVTGATKVAGEDFGRATIEDAAKRTAAEIADQLEVRFKQQGWIR